MDINIEILMWAIVVIIIFYVSNVYLRIRTAASLFLSFLIGGFIIHIAYRSIVGDVVIVFAIFIGMIYAFFRSISDLRTDIPNDKQSITSAKEA